MREYEVDSYDSILGLQRQRSEISSKLATCESQIARDLHDIREQCSRCRYSIAKYKSNINLVFNKLNQIMTAIKKDIRQRVPLSSFDNSFATLINEYNDDLKSLVRKQEDLDRYTVYLDELKELRSSCQQIRTSLNQWKTYLNEVRRSTTNVSGLTKSQFNRLITRLRSAEDHEERIRLIKRAYRTEVSLSSSLTSTPDVTLETINQRVEEIKKLISSSQTSLR